MKFSLVIPLAPGRDAPILESIKQLNYPKSEFHVVVVRGLNPSENRNKGAEKAKGDIIAFLDDDATLEKDYLKKAEEFFHRHPEVDIVGGPQLSPLDEKGFAKISGYALTSEFGAFGRVHRYSPKKESFDVDESMFTSANLLCRKSVMDKIKFDINLFPGEDPKFIDDAKKASFKIAYTPEIIIYHKRRSTIKAFSKQMFNYGKTRPFKDNFFDTLKRPYVLVPSIFVIYFVFILLFFGYNFAITGNAISHNYPQLPVKVPYLNLILLTPIAAYFILSIIFAFQDSRKNKHMNAFFAMPFIYFIIHVSYGAGMIWGYIKKNFTGKSVG